MPDDTMHFRFAPDGADLAPGIEATCNVGERQSVGWPPVRIGGGNFSRVVLRVAPHQANVTALASIALARRCDGSLTSGRLDIAGAAGRAALAEAAVRSLKVRAGLARKALEFEYHFLGRPIRHAVGRLADGPSGATPAGVCGFSFDNCRAEVDKGQIEIKEFSICISNNIFIPSRHHCTAGLVPGRQGFTGYICVCCARSRTHGRPARRKKQSGPDAQSLLDGEAHSLRIMLPSERKSVLLYLPEVLFNWRRRIDTLAAGELDVLYFEDMGTGTAADISFTLGSPAGPGRAGAPPPAGCG